MSANRTIGLIALAVTAWLGMFASAPIQAQQAAPQTSRSNETAQEATEEATQDTAQMRSSGGQQATGQATAQAASRDMRASKLIGKEVVDTHGESLGEIENLVVDLDNGRVRYAVMSISGVAGVGEKLFAFPISTFAVDREERLVLNVDKAQLEKAPGFEPDRRPNFGDETYRTAVDRFFFKEDITRYTPSGARLVDASNLIGKEINDRSASNAGKIEDLVVHLGNGRAYALVKVDKAWSPTSKTVAMPFMAFTVPSRPDLDIALNVDRAQLEAASNLEDGEWPDLNAPAIQRDITEQLARFRSASKTNPGATQSGASTPAGSSRSSQ